MVTWTRAEATEKSNPVVVQVELKTKQQQQAPGRELCGESRREELFQTIYFHIRILIL